LKKSLIHRQQTLRVRVERLSVRTMPWVYDREEKALWTLARAFLGGADSEITCLQCLAEMPTYLVANCRTAEVSQANVQLTRQHLDSCAACRAAYRDLIAAASAHDQPHPGVRTMPVPDLSFLDEVSHDE
jgi:hypothetical protein